MSFTWVDFVILAVLLVTLILGLIKGFVRQIIGIVAVVAGLILAAKYYRAVSGFFGWAVSAERWSHLIAFLVIFFVVLAVGGLISFLASKLIKGPLAFIDHLLGGVLGLFKGILISGVLVFALLAFPIDKQALMGSSLAPYCYWITKGIVHLIPQELREKFKETYQEIGGGARNYGEKI